MYAQDQHYMKLALTLAEKTVGQTSPNPIVGAVVVKNGQIIGVGTHLRAGGAHAEIHALEMAGNEAVGADIYVTLEPCNHHGKTAPCTERIISAQIKRVIIATLDPNPLVSGRGVAQLREANIEVETGLYKDEADELNTHFFHFIKTGMPYVTLKAGFSLDGKIATHTGDSKWITSPEARLDVHQLRHEHDAILVGIQTVIADDPLLTTRLPQGGKNPIRIVLDTHLRIPINARVITDQSTKTIIFTGNKLDEQKASFLKEKGVAIERLPTESIEITDVLRRLGQRKITSLLVEGGGEVHASFIKNEAFQTVIFYVAPLLIGGKNATAVIGELGVSRMSESIQLSYESVERVGPDLKIIAKRATEKGVL